MVVVVDGTLMGVATKWIKCFFVFFYFTVPISSNRGAQSPAVSPRKAGVEHQTVRGRRASIGAEFCFQATGIPIRIGPAINAALLSSGFFFFFSICRCFPHNDASPACRRTLLKREKSHSSGNQPLCWCHKGHWYLSESSPALATKARGWFHAPIFF